MEERLLPVAKRLWHKRNSQDGRYSHDQGWFRLVDDGKERNRIKGEEQEIANKIIIRRVDYGNDILR